MSTTNIQCNLQDPWDCISTYMKTIDVSRMLVNIPYMDDMGMVTTMVCWLLPELLCHTMNVVLCNQSN